MTSSRGGWLVKVSLVATWLASSLAACTTNQLLGAANLAEGPGPRPTELPYGTRPRQQLDVYRPTATATASATATLSPYGGTALAFDGMVDAMQIGWTQAVGPLSGRSAWTFEAWVNPADLSIPRVIYAEAAATGAPDQGSQRRACRGLMSGRVRIGWCRRGVARRHCTPGLAHARATHPAGENVAA